MMDIKERELLQDIARYLKLLVESNAVISENAAAILRVLESLDEKTPRERPPERQG